MKKNKNFMYILYSSVALGLVILGTSISIAVSGSSFARFLAGLFYSGDTIPVLLLATILVLSIVEKNGRANSRLMLANDILVGFSILVLWRRALYTIFMEMSYPVSYVDWADVVFNLLIFAGVIAFVILSGYASILKKGWAMLRKKDGEGATTSEGSVDEG